MAGYSQNNPDRTKAEAIIAANNKLDADRITIRSLNKQLDELEHDIEILEDALSKCLEADVKDRELEANLRAQLKPYQDEADRLRMQKRGLIVVVIVEGVVIVGETAAIIWLLIKG